MSQSLSSNYCIYASLLAKGLRSTVLLCCIGAEWIVNLAKMLYMNSCHFWNKTICILCCVFSLSLSESLFHFRCQNVFWSCMFICKTLTDSYVHASSLKLSRQEQQSIVSFCFLQNKQLKWFRVLCSESTLSSSHMFFVSNWPRKAL